MTTNNRIFGNTRFGPNLSHLPGIPKYRRGVTDGVTRFFSVFPVAFLGGLSAQSCADLCLLPRHSSGHRCQRPPGLPRQGGSDGWGWPSAHAPVGRGRGAGSGQGRERWRAFRVRPRAASWAAPGPPSPASVPAEAAVQTAEPHAAGASPASHLVSERNAPFLGHPTAAWGSLLAAAQPGQP